MQPFIVKLIGLAKGESRHEWHAGPEFFGNFENSEILDADLEAVVFIDNHGATVDVECELEGSVTVACDRCLEDLVIPVKTSFEESYVPETDELDLSQEVYDYVCISLPMQRVHEEGECNQETIKYLSK